MSSIGGSGNGRGTGRGAEIDPHAYEPPRGSIPTLEVPSLAGIRQVFMIGIGGAGMRNLARLLLARGVAVRGSDLKDSQGVAELRARGRRRRDRARADANLGDPDAVVVSSAIHDTNPELAEARVRGIPVWARAQALAAAAAGRRQISITGTHGKTTTTAMIAHDPRSGGPGPHLRDRRRSERERERGAGGRR